MKLIATDGMKSANMLTSNDPDIWTFFSNAPQSSRQVLYGYVAAVFRAYNLKANTVGDMPFVLYQGETEYDNSATWQNKVGFLPNPSELFRIDTLSYIDTNTIYNVKTTDVLGYKTRGLYNAVPTTFTPDTDIVTGALLSITRQVGTKTEVYTPDDKRLFRAWRLDHTTEVLPSINTEAQAIQRSAEIILYSDAWIGNYFRRGGIKPTLIAMKGLVSNDNKEDKEKSWTDWLRGLGKYTHRIARIFNAEAMDIKPFGDGIADLKDNPSYNAAIANIAMGTGMPLSLLMANSANYATSKEEKATWYENDIIPFCNWLAYEYNRQIFQPLGLRLEFHPETLDPQQEDETERAAAINTFIDFLGKCPTYDIFIGTCETFGYELSDSLISAADAYYKDKEKKADELQAQMGAAGVIAGPDGKPIPVQNSEQEQSKQDDEEDAAEDKPTKSSMTVDEIALLSRWREICNRRLKRHDSLDFEFHSEDKLPANTVQRIKAALLNAKTFDDIKAAFDIDVPVEIKAENEIVMLAQAMNRLADSAFKS